MTYVTITAFKPLRIRRWEIILSGDNIAIVVRVKGRNMLLIPYRKMNWWQAFKFRAYYIFYIDLAQEFVKKCKSRLKKSKQPNL